MKRAAALTILASLAAAAAIGTTAGAAEEGPLAAGFGIRTVTPHGPSPEGWDFWVNPTTGTWSEEFTDQNANGYYDPGEPFVDDVRNTAIDPQSAGKWDGCWTNAGFSGRGALGKHDDVWARALVMQAGDTKVALVSLDAVGFFYEEIERVRAELAAAHPDIGIDMLVVSSTHTHESCDTMGYWGNPIVVHDGKFPLWQSYIRSRIVEAVAEADARLEPARMKASTTTHTTGIRDSRDPQVIDPYLQSAQFVRPDDSVIGTIVNWSNHPEALASGNRFISSDFPHGARAKLESATGAPAIYFSGSVGGLMTPLRVDIPGHGTDATLARAYYIGELVADAALASLAGVQPVDVTSLDVAAKEVFLPGDNVALRALNVLGIFDKPTFQNGIPAERFGEEFKTQIVSIKAGPVRFQTVPGELFPEIEIGGYGRTNCPDGASADTGRPHEPVISQQFGEEHQFVLGLAQDELGYIVPGYDFWVDGPKADNVVAAGTRTPRPLVGGFGGLFPNSDDPCGEGHYEETVSASSVMAPVVACTIAELAGRNPWSRTGEAGYAACTTQNTTVGPQGTHPSG